MGAWEDRQDARAAGDHAAAFRASLEILNRKGSKRLMAAEIEECVQELRALHQEDLLPGNFGDYSVYGQRERLNALAPYVQGKEPA